MLKNGFIKNIIWGNKNRLIITYSLFSLEMAAALLKPYFLGEAVNHLLKDSYTMLIVFLGVHLVWLIVGTLRLRYDTRTYTSIYNHIITHYLQRKRKEQNVSKLSALSTLTREFTDFLEYDLIFILEAVYNIIGSLILIYFFDKWVIVLCIVILIPVLYISKKYGHKMQLLTQYKNDELEKQVDIIGTYNQPQINRHYRLLRKWQIKISDQQAFNFCTMELLVMVMLGASLILSTHYNYQVLNAGEIISFYFYILKFTSGLDTLPYITEKYALLNDITNRIYTYENEDALLNT